MRVATGKVIDGRVVVEGTAFDEGSVVTVLARDDDETFELAPDQEAELLAAIAEAERGEVTGLSKDFSHGSLKSLFGRLSEE
jgi:hypothetical protein